MADEVCGQHKIFERDHFAQTPRAEVWCQKKPHGKDEGHEAIKGTTAYCWRDEEMTAPADTGIVLLSGGLDSTVLAYYAATAAETVVALSVAYGQRHVKELVAAQRIAVELGAEWIYLNLTDLGGMLTSSLTGTGEIPHGHYEAESMKSTVVPNRNAILASLAYGIGVSRQAAFVWMGSHAGDHMIYPDCRPEFFTALNTALHIGNSWKPTDMLLPALKAPFINKTKTEIVQLGSTLGVPFKDTWSCYEGGTLHCGRCGTCVERKEAFELAGVADLTDYAD